MIEYIAILTPVLLGLAIYFVRLEGRLGKIITDICWIKREIGKCQPSLEKSTK